MLVDGPIKLMPMFTWYPVSNSGLDACFDDDDDKRQIDKGTYAKDDKSEVKDDDADVKV